MFYTGIGSRATPEEIQWHMMHIAEDLASLGLTLRSGGAGGADTAFESGCDHRNGTKEIYLPWKGFNGREGIVIDNPEAENLASQIHPAWHNCSQAARLLHTRNVYQVLGSNLDAPSEFVVCYTLKGQLKGGTATAIRLAISKGIPVFNLGSMSLDSVIYSIAELIGD